MSTRALRKLQKEQELEKQAAAAANAEVEDESEDEEDDTALPTTSRAGNAFDMLNAAEDEDQSEDEEDSGPVPVIKPDPAPSQPSEPKPAKRKKKKQKKKNKSTSDTPQTHEDSSDEIDKALAELSVQNPRISQTGPANAWEASATELLAIEQKNLDPVNEMRGLFGNIALEAESRPRPAPPQRRRDANQQGGVDLETALTGRYSVASRGKELGSLAKRRNCFMQGKEQWPLATSGGLSMEALPSTDFTHSFNIVHNNTYKETQWNFKMAVESMQAENMIALLARYPYHVASLLQVSEIAKHQGDSFVAGDLLERALFTLGRSVHSSFPSAIRKGTARVPFEKSANRELYLTIWRYMRNLEQRGTWKTAFEWAKLLLQLDTTSDPYGITLTIDHLALRGRQHEQLLELTSDSAYGPAWRHLPNIQISLVIALLRAGKPKEARKHLAITMQHYPYILNALATELDITPIPKAIWGKLPESDAEKLYTQLYITRAKDLWNTPDTIGLITEVANTLTYYKDAINAAPAPPKLSISLEEARHIMLLEIPQLIALLPRTFTNMPTSSSDVLPPPDAEALSDMFTRRAPDSSNRPALPAFLQQALAAIQAPTNATNDTNGEPTAEAPPTGIRGILDRLTSVFTSSLNDANPQSDEEAMAHLQGMRNQIRNEMEGMDDDQLDQFLASGQAPETLADIHELEDAFSRQIAGGWDYYAEAAEEGEDDTDDMPSLEGESDYGDFHDHPGEILSEDDEEFANRNPHAATVEEADDDEDHTAEHTTGRSILRHIDSDDEDSPPFARPAAQSTSTPATQIPTSTPTSTPANAPAEPEVDTSDPQRLQRWLITTGLDELQAQPTSNIVLTKYIEKLKALPKAQQNWVVGVVRQRQKTIGDRLAGAIA